MSSEGFCTFCLNSGKDKKDCFGHFPGKNCPTLSEIECSRCHETGHTRGHCNAMFCKFCKSIGHDIDDCEKLKEKIEREKNAFCNFCKETGHFIKNCEKIKEKEKNAWCGFCEEEGHSTRNCNNPYNSKNINRLY